MKRKQREFEVAMNKRHLKRKKASNRYFLDQDSMGEARWYEAVEYSVAKREGRKIGGVKHVVWHCPCACISAHPNELTGASLSKQPKSQRKPAPRVKGKVCYHFGGKSI